MASFSFLFLLFFSNIILLYSTEGQENSYNPFCQPFLCGKLGKIGFPFTNKTHPEYGLFPIDKCNHSFKTGPKIQLEKNGTWYEVNSISEAASLDLLDRELKLHLQSRSCDFSNDLSLPKSSLITNLFTPNLTLFVCNRTLGFTSPKFMLFKGCDDYDVFYNAHNDSTNLHSFPPQCSYIQLPLDRSQLYDNDLFTLLTANFRLEVNVSPECLKCHIRGGQCQIKDEVKFHCTAIAEKGKKGNTMVITAATASGVGVVVIVLVLVCLFRSKTLFPKFIFLRNKETSANHNIEYFLNIHGPLAIKRYSYSNIRKLTNSFKDKLGQVGYGTVYKAKLHVGRLVAVKVLNESKGNGEEFINEVAAICRTSHVNIVSLLGFCFEGQKSALVYEFMPNGSLERFIYDQGPDEQKNIRLGCEMMLQISLGIARGLEYLHRGCNTRILNFDIKPHNILLDEDFCPKISDFGLAKICPRKKSIISMSDARGTPGYTAPEVFCKNFGGVSHKSDVYSYGMMVLEMVGERQNVNAGVDRSSEIYFPDWIYKHLELDHEELKLQSSENEKDKECARKMIIVSLWCIQTDPSMRPAMNRVVEMLEGNLESLEVPPKPFFASPSQLPLQSSSSSSMVSLP